MKGWVLHLQQVLNVSKCHNLNSAFRQHCCCWTVVKELFWMVSYCKTMFYDWNCSHTYNIRFPLVDQWKWWIEKVDCTDWEWLKCFQINPTDELVRSNKPGLSSSPGQVGIVLEIVHFHMLRNCTTETNCKLFPMII